MIAGVVEVTSEPLATAGSASGVPVTVTEKPPPVSTATATVSTWSTKGIARWPSRAAPVTQSCSTCSCRESSPKPNPSRLPAPAPLGVTPSHSTSQFPTKAPEKPPVPMAPSRISMLSGTIPGRSRPSGKWRVAASKSRPRKPTTDVSGGGSSPVNASWASVISMTNPVSPIMNGGRVSEPTSEKLRPPSASRATLPAVRPIRIGSGTPSASSNFSHSPGSPVTGTSSGVARTRSSPRSTTRTANGPVQSTSTVSCEPCSPGSSCAVITSRPGRASVTSPVASSTRVLVVTPPATRVWWSTSTNRLRSGVGKRFSGQPVR